MNTQVGKSTGIALLMAAALLAALFSMGVFSAGSVGAHDPAPDATPPVLAHDHVNALTALLLDKDGTYIEEDGMDDGSQTSSPTVLN